MHLKRSFKSIAPKVKAMGNAPQGHQAIDCPLRGQCFAKPIINLYKPIIFYWQSIKNQNFLIDRLRRRQCITPYGGNRLPPEGAMHGRKKKK